MPLSQEDIDKLTEVRSRMFSIAPDTTAQNFVASAGGGGGGLNQSQVDARVTAGISAWVGAAPGALDTLAEIAAQIEADGTAIGGLTTAIAGKADTTHTHAQSDVTGLVTALAGKAAASHTHAQSEITNLVSDLAGKASTSHNHDATYAALSHTHTALYQPLATVLTNTTASFTTAQETKLSGIATGATANATDAQLRDRSTHTGTQSADTVIDGTTNKAFTATEKTKLAGVATGATANSADATLLSRANHTGTQAASTISDFSTAADARIAAASVDALADVTVTSPSVGQVLKWSGTAWTNQADATGSGTNGYAIAVQALTSSPVDAQTIYFGNIPAAPTTTAATRKIYIRANGVIKRAEIYCFSGTAGTAEAWPIYIRVNNTTDTLISSVALGTSERIFTNSSLNISVSAGDYIEIKAVNPTWVTNPLTTIFGGYIYVEG